MRLEGCAHGSQAAVDEVNKAKKPRRMAVLRGIPADDDGEKVAVGGNQSQPRVVPTPPSSCAAQSGLSQGDAWQCAVAQLR